MPGESELDLDALRARLGLMSGRELVGFGRSTRYMCSPGREPRKEPRQALVIQLKEVVEESSPPD